jgi:hypothetical protein
MEKDLQISIPTDYTVKKSNKILKKLVFGKQKIILSNEELANLEKIYKHYVDMFGVEIGFINYLLNIR